jgi:hypothetical protein
MIVMKEKGGELVSFTRLPDEDPTWERNPLCSITVTYIQRTVEAKILRNDSFNKLIQRVRHVS